MSPPYAVDAWTANDGLPQNSINAIEQTPDGYLWLGTFGGLVRFDGVTFRTFTSANTPGLGDIRILTLRADRTGALWIGTETAGLFVMRDGVVSVPPWRASLPGPAVRAIHESGDGALWIGTSAGVARVDAQGKVTAYPARQVPQRPYSQVLAIEEAPAGTIWAGALGAMRIQGDAIQDLSWQDPRGDDPVYAIGADTTGTIWMGSQHGLLRFDGGRLIDVPLPGTPRAKPLSVYAVLGGPDGRLWIGTREGLFVRDGQTILPHAPQGVLSTASITSMRVDREGSLWVGTASNGLYRLRPHRATSYLPVTRERLSIVPIVDDGAGGVWMGATCGGLWHLRGQRFEHYGVAQGLPKQCIWALHRDPDGTLWLGTNDGGLLRLQGDRYTVLAAAQGLSGRDVNSIVRDRQGVLWVGTERALNRLNPDDTFVGYPFPVHPATGWFLAERRTGGLWVGTMAGLYLFANETFTRVATRDDDANERVRAVHEDADGTLWIGTYGGGLARVKDGRISRYTRANGLADDVVSRILDDGHGRLWLSGLRGVFVVTRQDLEDVAAGRERRLSCVSYDTSDGMLDRETNGGGQPAGLQSADGRLWFPTVAGVVSFDPTARLNPRPPSPVITRVLVDERAVDERAIGAGAIGAGAIGGPAALTMPAGTHSVRIEYAALSFIQPQKVQYRYRLEGHDPDWIEAGPRTSVDYTGLPPGSYRFEVRARNADGVWSTTTAALPIQQRPYFYQTRWFVALSVLGIFAGGVATQRLRVRHLGLRNRELETRVAARTGEVSAQRDQLSAAHDQLTHAHGDLLVVLDHLRLGFAVIARDGAARGTANRVAADRFAADRVGADRADTAPTGPVPTDPARTGSARTGSARTGTVTFVSDTVLRLTDRASPAIVGRPWQELLPLTDEDRRRLAEMLEQPAEARTRLLVRLEHADGRDYWTQVDVRDDPRDPSRQFLYFYDVTEVYRSRRILDGKSKFRGLVGESAAIRVIGLKILDAAAVDSSVLVDGETGTGKELVARAIHDLSARHERTFLAVNCAGLTESLLASQLFGHRRGAFTGAVADQMGVFEAATRGTLFLDEVGDMPPSVQSALLRVLQEKEITRLGESQPRKVDVRVICATHRDLQAEVAAGRFRQDLFYRIWGKRIYLPPLRDRREDVPVLVAWFLERARATGATQARDVSRAAMDLLLAHTWPGNVRELKTMIENACTGGRAPVIIEPTDLPPELLWSTRPEASAPAPTATAAADAASGDFREPRDREHVLAALARARGNRAEASRLLGISRTTLYRRLRELGLDTGSDAD